MTNDTNGKFDEGSANGHIQDCPYYSKIKERLYWLSTWRGTQTENGYRYDELKRIAELTDGVKC